MKKNLNEIYAIVPSAGIGTRFESEVPKQYIEVNGISILEKTINHFLDLEIFKKIIVPISREDNFFEKLSISNHEKIIKVVGGVTRSESVMSALGQ
jgi:4-diphosphocytidyl-2-methyl-D-erithritol synthase